MILYSDRTDHVNKIDKAGKAERISKILSVCSICSRREAEKLIAQGRILLNGAPVIEQGAKAVIGLDKIYIDGVLLTGGRYLKGVSERRFGYYILNKPPGYLCTCKDPFGRRTIFDLLDLKGRFFPAGRLDLESRGLVFITDDGLLCSLITHPRNMILKTYEVTLNKNLNADSIKRLQTGILYEGVAYRALKVEKKNDRVYIFILNEGKKREIRQMIKACGAEVEDLFRTAIANLSVAGLKEGESRKLDAAELAELKKTAGYEKAGAGSCAENEDGS